MTALTRDWIIRDERRVPAEPMFLAAQGWTRSHAAALRFATQVDAANWIADLRAQNSSLLHNRTVGASQIDKLPDDRPVSGAGVADSEHDPFGFDRGEAEFGILLPLAFGGLLACFAFVVIKIIATVYG